MQRIHERAQVRYVLCQKHAFAQHAVDSLFGSIDVVDGACYATCVRFRKFITHLLAKGDHSCIIMYY